MLGVLLEVGANALFECRDIDLDFEFLWSATRKQSCRMDNSNLTFWAGELAQCMVRRVNAREKFRMKESLRQCIRPLGGEFSPGLDEIRRVPVLRKRAGLVRTV